MKQPKPDRRKSGPHEKLHSLYPMTFDEALGKLLSVKPSKKTKKIKKKTENPKEANPLAL